MIALPDILTLYTGRVICSERPTQGLYYQVSILTTEQGRYVLKQSHDTELIDELARECQVLTHIQDQTPFVPTPIAHATVDGVGYYLFTCIEGENLLDALHAAPVTERHHLAEDFGRALAKIHTWAPNLPQPEDWLAKRVSRAISRVEQGLVPNPIQRRSQFNGADPTTVLAELKNGFPGLELDLVFGHGDYAVTNALVREGQVVGVIDWSSGGYRDRRADLAQAVKSLRFNLQDERLVDSFLMGYGYAQPKELLRWFEALGVLL